MQTWPRYQSALKAAKGPAPGPWKGRRAEPRRRKSWSWSTMYSPSRGYTSQTRRGRVLLTSPGNGSPGEGLLLPPSRNLHGGRASFAGTMGEVSVRAAGQLIHWTGLPRVNSLCRTTPGSPGNKLISNSAKVSLDSCRRKSPNLERRRLTEVTTAENKGPHSAPRCQWVPSLRYPWGSARLPQRGLHPPPGH